MRPLYRAILFGILALTLAPACRTFETKSSQPQGTSSERHIVYILSGQSNMAGQSPLNDEARRIQVPNVEIFCIEHWKFQADREEYQPGEAPPRWEPLRPCGAGKDFFGPELTFAQDAQKKNPGAKIYLLKYGQGGTTLGCDWQPTPPSSVFSRYGASGCAKYKSILNQSLNTHQTYRRFQASINWGLNALKARGINPELGALLWFQGETDANGLRDLRFLAESYEENLRYFVQTVRRNLQQDSLPIALGKIKCGYTNAEWDPSVNPRDLVRQADDRVAATLPNVVTFDSLDLTMQADNCHYDAPSMLTIGHRFAKALGLGS